MCPFHKPHQIVTRLYTVVIKTLYKKVNFQDIGSGKCLFFGKRFKEKLLNIFSNFFFIGKYNPSG